jgi:hypothetical protein
MNMHLAVLRGKAGSQFAFTNDLEPRDKSDNTVGFLQQIERGAVKAM